MPVPEHCRAAVVEEFGSPMQIRDVRVPSSLEPGAILTRNVLATVCATDVHFWTGDAPAGFLGELPIVLGHEVVGRVEVMNGVDTDAVGQDLRIGDRVVWTHEACGRCRNCVVDHQPTLCSNRKMSMAGSTDVFPYLGGAFAEYGYVFPRGGAIRVPDEISDCAASAASCALQTIVHAYERSGGVDEGTVVAVQGSGPLGLFSVARFVAAGAKVLLVGGSAPRLDLAREWGAAEVLDIDDASDTADRVRWVQDMTGGRGADIVVEASGVPAAFAEGVDMVADGGRYVVVGQGHNVQVPFNPSALTVRNLLVVGVRAAAPHHTWRAMEFLHRHRARFDWDKMVTSVRPLGDIDEAFRGMGDWSEIKPAIDLQA